MFHSLEMSCKVQPALKGKGIRSPHWREECWKTWEQYGNTNLVENRREFCITHFLPFMHSQIQRFLYLFQFSTMLINIPLQSTLVWHQTWSIYAAPSRKSRRSALVFPVTRSLCAVSLGPVWGQDQLLSSEGETGSVGFVWKRLLFHSQAVVFMPRIRPESTIMIWKQSWESSFSRKWILILEPLLPTPQPGTGVPMPPPSNRSPSRKILSVGLSPEMRSTSQNFLKMQAIWQSVTKISAVI